MEVVLLAAFLLNELQLSLQDPIPAVLRCSGNLSDFTYYDCQRPSTPGHNTACFGRDGIGFGTCFSICDGVSVGSYEGLKSYKSCEASCKSFMNKECTEVGVTTSPQSPEIANASSTLEFIESTASSLTTTSLSAITTALPDVNYDSITAYSICIPIAAILLVCLLAEVIQRCRKQTSPSAAFLACIKKIYQKAKSTDSNKEGGEQVIPLADVNKPKQESGEAATTETSEAADVPHCLDNTMSLVPNDQT